jgi:hypothetical protein
MSLPVSKKSLTETDIRTKFITPAVLGPDGSKWDSMTQVRAAIACIAQAFNWRFSTVVMVRNFSTQPRLHSRCSNRRTPNMHTPIPSPTLTGPSRGPTKAPPAPRTGSPTQLPKQRNCQH